MANQALNIFESWISNSHFPFYSAKSARKSVEEFVGYPYPSGKIMKNKKGQNQFITIHLQMSDISQRIKHHQEFEWNPTPSRSTSKIISLKNSLAHAPSNILSLRKNNAAGRGKQMFKVRSLRVSTARSVMMLADMPCHVPLCNNLINWCWVCGNLVANDYFLCLSSCTAQVWVSLDNQSIVNKRQGSSTMDTSLGHITRSSTRVERLEN